jgi:hypothetical protein
VQPVNRRPSAAWLPAPLLLNKIDQTRRLAPGGCLPAVSSREQDRTRRRSRRLPTALPLLVNKIGLVVAPGGCLCRATSRSVSSSRPAAACGPAAGHMRTLSVKVRSWMSLSFEYIYTKGSMILFPCLNASWPHTYVISEGT